MTLGSAPIGETRNLALALLLLFLLLELERVDLVTLSLFGFLIYLLHVPDLILSRISSKPSPYPSRTP